MHRIIDWNELWKAIHVASPERNFVLGDPAATWDKRAAAYHRISHGETEATKRDPGFIDLRPGDTVLDMGAGTGRLTVPLAGRAAHVTALDPSGGMFGILRKRMEEAGYHNYCNQMKWRRSSSAGRSRHLTNIVIAAFSPGFYDPACALAKLTRQRNGRSISSGMLVSGGGLRRWGSARAQCSVRRVPCKVLAGIPDYSFPINILHNAGIFANVRIYPALLGNHL